MPYADKDKQRIYNIWTGMKTRCYNQKSINYKTYGEKGITICSKWLKSFDDFYDWAISNGYNSNLTIDRIDNNEGYYPENCRWATKKEQANNRKNNNLICLNGETKTLAQWAEYSGIGEDAIRYRLQKGLPEEAILMSNESFKYSQYSLQGKNDGHLIEYNGEIHNIKEWAKIFNIKESTLSKRITQDKSPFEKAILSDDDYLDYRREFNKHLKMYNIEGKKHTLKEWSEISGINYSTLKKRINKDGVDIKTALLPSKNYRKRGK